MCVKEVVIWSLVNGKRHRSAAEKDMQVSSLGQLVNALFPGMNYFSVTGFSQVVNEFVVPVLKKKFPVFLSATEKDVSPDALVNVEPFIPSKGYEWENNRWKKSFKKLLEA